MRCLCPATDRRMNWRDCKCTWYVTNSISLALCYFLTLVYLLSEHVRLTIFQNLSGLYGLNRYCSLNFFQEKFKPVRLIDTVRLTFLRKKLAKTYDLLIKMQYYWSGIVINKNLYKFFCPGCFYQSCLLNCFLKNSEPVRLIDPVRLTIFGKILTLYA